MTPLLCSRRRCGVLRRRCRAGAVEAAGTAAAAEGGAVPTAAGDGGVAVDTAPDGGVGWLMLSPRQPLARPVRIVRRRGWPFCCLARDQPTPHLDHRSRLTTDPARG